MMDIEKIIETKMEWAERIVELEKQVEEKDKKIKLLEAEIEIIKTLWNEDTKNKDKRVMWRKVTQK